MNNRAIDELIAEKVMGWIALEGDAIVERERAGRTMGDVDPADNSRWHNKKIWINSAGEQMACAECGTMPEFSTEPFASKRLREKILADGHSWQILSPFAGKLIDVPEFGCVIDNETGKAVTMTGATEELAVALCALKSMGVDVEGIDG